MTRRTGSEETILQALRGRKRVSIVRLAAITGLRVDNIRKLVIQMANKKIVTFEDDDVSLGGST